MASNAGKFDSWIVDALESVGGEDMKEAIRKARTESLKLQEELHQKEKGRRPGGSRKNKAQGRKKDRASAQWGAGSGSQEDPARLEVIAKQRAEKQEAVRKAGESSLPPSLTAWIQGNPAHALLAGELLGPPLAMREMVAAMPLSPAPHPADGRRGMPRPAAPAVSPAEPEASKDLKDIPDDLTPESLFSLGVRAVFANGALSAGETQIFAALRQVLQLPRERETALVAEAKAEFAAAGKRTTSELKAATLYAAACRMALKDGVVSSSERSLMDQLGEALGIDAAGRGRLDAHVEAYIASKQRDDS